MAAKTSPEIMTNYVLTLLIAVGLTFPAFSQAWKIADAPLKTPWAEQVNPASVLPEYPRPQMTRDRWQSLNGVWEFQPANEGEAVPQKKALTERILVPFAWESALSGIRRQLPTQRAWYRRTFTVPDNWKQERVLLHFEAVDWETMVYVNGRAVGTHRGGYDSFSFDITPFLAEKGPQEIIVGVYDPGTDAGIACGKQQNDRFNDPHGYAYAGASGIWQSVWLEPVAPVHIRDYHLTPDLDAGQITVTVNPSKLLNNRWKADVIAYDGKTEVARATGGLNVPIIVSIQNRDGGPPKTWSPDSPFLYDLKIVLRDSLTQSDVVGGYFGMRKISLLPQRNVPRLALNNQFLFQMGPLDQGYWPDGIYTAPTDEALRWDIEKTKEWGFNMIRKHIKIESKRWYYWCDKLGILVWQDMPSTFKKRTEDEKTQFETELQQMVKQHWNSPSIVHWVVFNEHWGLYDVERLTNFVMALDPSRLVIGNSGIDAGRPHVDYEVGHIKDNHSYRPPSVPLISSKRATVNGEYGAIGYKAEGHVWDTNGPWVHFNYAGNEAATAEYEKFIGQITDKLQPAGLSAAVYTQWTDVENEMNGLYTYDRKLIKLDKDRVTKANRQTWAQDRLK
jgi:beta-galactosidase/beta-glucuronidase